MSYSILIKPGKAPELKPDEIHVIVRDGQVVDVLHGEQTKGCSVVVVQDPLCPAPDYLPTATELRGEET